MSKENGHSDKIVTEYITLPCWSEIQSMSIAELTEVKLKVEKYNQIISRIIRARLEK